MAKNFKKNKIKIAIGLSSSLILGVALGGAIFMQQSNNISNQVTLSRVKSSRSTTTKEVAQRQLQNVDSSKLVLSLAQNLSKSNFFASDLTKDGNVNNKKIVTTVVGVKSSDYNYSYNKKWANDLTGVAAFDVTMTFKNDKSVKKTLQNVQLQGLKKYRPVMQLQQGDIKLKRQYVNSNNVRPSDIAAYLNNSSANAERQWEVFEYYFEHNLPKNVRLLNIGLGAKAGNPSVGVLSYWRVMNKAVKIGSASEPSKTWDMYYTRNSSVEVSGFRNSKFAETQNQFAILSLKSHLDYSKTYASDLLQKTNKNLGDANKLDIEIWNWSAIDWTKYNFVYQKNWVNDLEGIVSFNVIATPKNGRGNVQTYKDVQVRNLKKYVPIQEVKQGEIRFKQAYIDANIVPVSSIATYLNNASAKPEKQWEVFNDYFDHNLPKNVILTNIRLSPKRGNSRIGVLTYSRINNRGVMVGTPANRNKTDDMYYTREVSVEIKGFYPA